MAIDRVSIFVAGLLLVLGSACATDYLSLASKSVEEQQYVTAVEFLRQGAREGDSRCDYYLAVLMLSGDLAGGRDPKAASKWLINAATEGLPRAQLDLGRLYETGDGVDRDPAKAAQWYRKAAVAGLPAGQAQLGFLYAAGRGVEQDVVLAAKWYRKAAKRGDPSGQAALGVATFQGVGVPKNVVDGYVWTRLAARQGNSDARSNLPAMAVEMTDKELKKARYIVSKSLVKPAKSEHSPRGTRIFDSKDSVRQRRGTPGR